MKKKNQWIIKDKLELIISQIGEKDFIKMLKLFGYKLTDKEKFYGRNKSNSR